MLLLQGTGSAIGGRLFVRLQRCLRVIYRIDRWIIAYWDIRNTVELDRAVFDNSAREGRSAGFNCDNGFDKLRSRISPQPIMDAALGMGYQDGGTYKIQQVSSSGLHEGLFHAIVLKGGGQKDGVSSEEADQEFEP